MAPIDDARRRDVRQRAFEIGNLDFAHLPIVLSV
jgi:hypothetical protein